MESPIVKLRATEKTLEETKIELARTREELHNVKKRIEEVTAKTDVEIAAERTMIKERIKREINPAATFIDSVLDREKIKNEIKNKNVKSESLYYLAESLKLLSTADMAVFAHDWLVARGCRIEETAARQYGIDVHYI